MMYKDKREYFNEKSCDICQLGIPSEEYMSEIAEAYGHAYDDRDGIISGPTLREMALMFKTSEVRIRKILITKGLYSTKVTREVLKLRQRGLGISDICKIMGLKPAAVKAALPYEKGVYNIDPKSSLGVRVEKSRKRKAAVEALHKSLACNEMFNADIIETRVVLDRLWECIAIFQGYAFMTSGRSGKGAVRFKYYLKVSKRTGEVTDELIIDRKENSKSITRSTVEMAFVNALKEQAAAGYVKGPKKLKVFGASYLYAMFLRFGVIRGVE